MTARRSGTRLIVLLAVVVLAGAAGVLLLHLRRRHHTEAQRDAQAKRFRAGPKLFVARVTPTPPMRELTLPSDVRAFNQTTLYAKLPGFLSEILVDKGDRVKAGQLLAKIASPETDQQVLNARAVFLNNDRFYKRELQLYHQRFIALQDLENAEYAMKESKATLQQELAIQEYELIRAPFSGTITGRYVDPGALIPAGTESTAQVQPVVDITEMETLRIAVFVSQDVAPFVNLKTPVTIVQDERPNLRIESTLTLVSGALDPRSRTMLCEVWLNNTRYHLQPGTFVHVTLHVAVPPLPTVPSAALFVRDGVLSAAVVRDGRIHLVPVKTGMDDGTLAQIRSGLTVGELVALNMPADLAEGSVVQPVEQPSGANRQAPPAGDGRAQGKKE